MKHHIIIYGCQMNHSDAERIDSLFLSLGSEKTAEAAEADIIVAVMCSVRQMAADRVFGLQQKFDQIKKNQPDFISVLTGCVVENDKEKFRKIFDWILDIKDLQKWPKILGLASRTEKDGDYFHILPHTSSKYSINVPISKGCDNYCTYCVVPYTRGRLESRPTADVVKECERAVKNGAKEIWLLGQNVNNYHWQDTDFATLLRAVNAIPGDFWIRFTSPHPKDFDAAAVISMAQCEKVTPYLNLPIQSGDNAILKAMGRPYTAARYRTLVKNIRQAFKKYRHGLEKEVSISTDIIVGFPGETKTQFLNSAKIFKAIKYEMAYIAQYSKRAGTAAAKLDDNIAPLEKKRREEAINDILKKTALAHNKKFIGKTVEVLVDSIKTEPSKWGPKLLALGKSRHYKTVKFTTNGRIIELGDIVKVKIFKAQSFGLVGTLNQNEK